MASDEEENRGVKRKSEESAEGSADKQLRPDDGPSTSSPTKQIKQAKGNEEKNWMKYCDVLDSEVGPRCTICDQHYLFNIGDLEIFKKHYETSHLDSIDDTEKNKSDWIFCHYTPSEINAQNLECNVCQENFKVSKFEGPFLNHFDDAHEHIAKLNSRKFKEDAEEAKRRRTKDFLNYLHKAFLNKVVLEGNENKKKYKKSKGAFDVRTQVWWMGHVKRVKRNTVFCGISGCTQAQKPFKVYLRPTKKENYERNAIKNHISHHYPKAQLGKNVKNWDLILLDDYIPKCQRCYMILSYRISTGFVTHLKDEHKFTKKSLVHQSRSGINNDEMINERIKGLFHYLIEKYKPWS